MRFGQLRHVQLLEPRRDVVRFATQVEIGVLKRHWPEGHDTCIALFEGESIEPVAEMAVGTSLIRRFTWTQRPAWFLLELESARRLVVLEPKRTGDGGWETGEGVRLLSFPEGEEMMSLAGVQEIEDVLVRAGQADLILRTSKRVRWLRLSKAGEVVSDETINLALSTVACAAFVRNAPGGELAAWGVGWKGKKLLAVPFNALGADIKSTIRVTFDGGPANKVLEVGEPLRAAVWVREDRIHLGLSWPGYDEGIGRVQVIDVSAAPKVLWEGEPNGDTPEQREYGQAIAFVPDADEDGVPDLLVTAPWCFVGTHVDLLSGRTGAMLKSWKPGATESTGHWLSLSADSRRALVGGTRFRSYPEDLANEGQAHLLDVIRMEKLQTWKLPCRER